MGAKMYSALAFSDTQWIYNILVGANIIWRTEIFCKKKKKN